MGANDKSMDGTSDKSKMHNYFRGFHRGIIDTDWLENECM
jgi:hypothetical protein